MRMLTRRFALVCVLSLVLYRPVDAQPFTQDVAEPQGRFTVGTLSFTPSALVLAGHDSNLKRAVGASAGGEFFDVAQVEAWWRPGRVRMAGSVAFEYQRDLSITRGHALNNAEELSLYTLTGRIRPTLTITRHNHFAPPSDFAGYEVGIKSRRVETEAEGKVSTLVGARTRLVGLSRLASLVYDADARYANVSLQDNLNRTGRFVGLSLEHSLTAQTTVFETGEVGQQRYTRTPLRNGTASSFGVGIRTSATALLSGSAFAGRRMYSSETSPLDNYQGFNWSANVMMSRPRYNVQFDAQRDFFPSYSAAFGQYVSTGSSLYGSAHASTRVDVYATVSRYALGYVSASGAVVSHITRSGAGVAYRFGQLLVGATGEWYSQSGTGAYRGRRVTTYMQVGGGRIRRLDRPLPGER